MKLKMVSFILMFISLVSLFAWLSVGQSEQPVGPAKYWALVDGKKYSIVEVQRRQQWLFVDERGNVVSDPALASKIARVAYVWEYIIGSNPRSGIESAVKNIDNLVRAFRNVKLLEAALHGLGRALADSIIAFGTGGWGTALPSVQGMPIRLIKEELSNSETLLAGFGLAILIKAQQDYKGILDRSLRISPPQPVDYNAAGEILEKYRTAEQLYYPSVTFVTDLMGLDKRWYHDIGSFFKAAADEMVSIVIARGRNINDVIQAAEAKSLAETFQRLMNFFPAGERFMDNLLKQERMVAALEANVEKWASSAVRAASELRQQPKPEITSSLRIIEPPSYRPGQTLTAEFSIRNAGAAPITFDVLTVGGRLNNIYPCQGKCPDFEHKRNITLAPNASYNYRGTLVLDKPGDYHFFTTYAIKDPQSGELKWNTDIPKVAGVTNTRAIHVEPAQGAAPPAGGPGPDSALLAQVQQVRNMLQQVSAQANQVSNLTAADRAAVNQELQRAGQALQAAEAAAQRGDRATVSAQLTQAQQAIAAVTQRISRITQPVGPGTTVTNRAPQARFNMASGAQSAQENGTLNLTVSPGRTATIGFSAARSSDPEGSALSYQWFMKGDMVNTARDFSFNLNKGIHQVVLKVKDREGLEAEAGATVSVTEPTTTTTAPDAKLLAQVQQMRTTWQQISAQANQVSYPTAADRAAVNEGLQRAGQALQAAEAAAQRGDRATVSAQLTQAQQAINAVSQRLAQLAQRPATGATATPQAAAPVTARIDGVVVRPGVLQVGQVVTLSVRFTNTGTTPHSFVAGASLWRPDGDLRADVDFERDVSLRPGETREVSWTHTVSMPGNWGYQFAVWKQRPYNIPQNLLAKQPSPIQFFSVARGR